MKNALILHGTEGSSEENWFPWLEKELVKRNYRVWTPDLPGSEKPNIARYNAFLRPKWRLNNESIIIGHSSGAVATLGFLQETPEATVIDTAFLVAGFIGHLGWDSLKELASYTLDWSKIKRKAKRFILFHSDNDPHAPIEHGKRLKENLNAEMIILPGQGHFSLSLDPRFTKFPELLEKILE